MLTNIQWKNTVMSPEPEACDHVLTRSVLTPSFAKQIITKVG